MKWDFTKVLVPVGFNPLQGVLGKTSGRSYKAAPRQLLQVDSAPMAGSPTTSPQVREAEAVKAEHEPQTREEITKSPLDKRPRIVNRSTSFSSVPLLTVYFRAPLWIQKSLFHNAKLWSSLRICLITPLTGRTTVELYRKKEPRPIRGGE